MGSLKDIFKKILDLLFPPRCPFCRAVLKDNETLLCTECSRSLPRTSPASQTQFFRHIDVCFSPLFYEGNVRRSLLRYKFGGLSVYAPKYASLMADCLEMKAPPFDVITWAPLGRKRLKKRGYDQARLLAEELSRLLHKPCRQLLFKAIENPPQSGTGSAEKRKANVSGVYRVTDARFVKGTRVLLVDDIVTTGATLSECAGTLKAAGAVSVCAVTLARTKQ